MRNRVIAGVMASLAVVAAAPALAAPAGPPPVTTLLPGGGRRIVEALDVNVVLIGLPAGSGPQQIDDTRFRSLLPAVSGAPFGVSPPIFGAPVLYELGLSHALRYNIVHTPAWFENALFGLLRMNALPQTASPFGPGWPTP